MKKIYHQYLNNIHECHRLAKANRFPVNEAEDVVLETIAEHARQAYRLRLENDAILKQGVFSKSAETLTPEEAKDLQEFADFLHDFNHQDDVGIAYKVHQLLLEYAKWIGDQDLYIRELYYSGISLFYLTPPIGSLGINPSGKEITAYFREGAGYITQLEEIQSEDTRAYVIRCVANLFVGDELIDGPHTPGTPYDGALGYPHFKKLFEEIMGIVESPYYQKLVPGFDWDALIHNLHFNRCTYYFALQRDDLPDIIPDMLESAEYLYEHKRKSRDDSIKGVRVDYLYAAVRRRAGLTDFSEAVRVLIDAVEGADPEDYSAKGVILNLQFPLYLEYTGELMTEEQRKPYEEQIEAIVSRIPRYLKKVPVNAFYNIVNEVVGETIEYCARINEPLNEKLFHFLLDCHAPTYIHVRLAASLSRKLFLRMAETAPERLSGLFGLTNPKDILAQKDALAQRVYDCSLYHDVGKIKLLDYVEIYNRALLDEEYLAICQHPQIGAKILQGSEAPELSAVALYHHCFYDMSGGYPQELPPCPPEYKPLVDIVSVSDSIEAATDNVGRCYAAPKSFETIIDELRNSPARYSPDVVALFDDREFTERIKSELQAERRKTYLEVYRGATE